MSEEDDYQKTPDMNTQKPLSWQEVEKARQEEFQNEEEIANSLEAWKERRKQKSLKQREAIGQATIQAREFVPSYEKKDIGLGRTSKYQELAARYSDTADGPESPRVLDENFDDSQNFDNIQNHINFEDSKKSEENSVGDSESSSQTDESQTEINQQPQIDNKMPIRQNNYQCFTIPVDKSDSGDNGVSSRCEIPPTVAVRPNNISSRPVVESLASQLQRQKISAEGASGYSKFKSDFQRSQSFEDDGSPLPRPTEFQQKRKMQFASKKALFEAQNSQDEPSHKNDRQSLPGSGVIQSARNSLFKKESSDQYRSAAKPISLVDQPRPSSAEKYRRDIRQQAAGAADFPDPPPPVNRPSPITHSHHSPVSQPVNHRVAAPLTYRNQPSCEHDEDEEIEANHMYSEPATPVRSLSEHRFEDKNVQLKKRANSCPDEKEIFSEVTVCMSQRPGSSRGFGFQVRGGDGKSPIIVDSIKPGGAAHVCELSVGDEVLTMNGMTVANLSQDQIVELMVEAVRTGQLRLRARRYNHLPRKKIPATPSLRLTSAAKMVATEGGFYQILADIPKKIQREHPNRPQPSPSPAGTLDSGHGSEQTGEALRSPDSVNSSPLQSPRRRNQEENRWLEELDNFELLREEQNQNFQRSRSNQLEMNGKKTWQNPSSARANFDEQDELESVLAIEQQEYEREIEDKRRRHEIQRDDEYTEEQISHHRLGNESQSPPSRGYSVPSHSGPAHAVPHWMVREAEMRRQNYSPSHRLGQLKSLLCDPKTQATLI